MAPTPPTIIVAHGAFHQPAHFIDFTAALDEVGLTEYRIPPLPSSGASPPENAFAQDVAILNKTIRSSLNSGRDVLVVAHSYGGKPLTDALVGFETAGKWDAKVLGVVFVAAHVPSPSQGDGMPKAPKVGAGSWVKVDGDLATANDAANALYNTCSDQKRRERAIELLQPQSATGMATPAKTTAYSHFPCAYIKCAKDNAVSPEIQDAMIATLKKQCDWQPTVTEIQTDHVPFVSAPETLAKLLKALVADAMEDGD